MPLVYLGDFYKFEACRSNPINPSQSPTTRTGGHGELVELDWTFLNDHTAKASHTNTVTNIFTSIIAHGCFFPKRDSSVMNPEH